MCDLYTTLRAAYKQPLFAIHQVFHCRVEKRNLAGHLDVWMATIQGTCPVCPGDVPPVPRTFHPIYHWNWNHNYYSQLSYFRALIRITVAVTVIIPFEKNLLPTGIIILRNYLEIGNALPYRKNCFQQLFGSVIPIKSVMDKLAGNLFFLLFFFWRGVLVLLPTHLLHFFFGKNSEFRIIQVKFGNQNWIGKKKITVTEKIAPGN